MYKDVFKSGELAEVDKPLKPDSVGFVYPDGSVSNSELHDQILDGANPGIGAAFAREQCKGMFTEEELNKFLPG